MMNYEKNKENKVNNNKIIAIVPLASKNRMTIPSALRDMMQIERGDFIVFLNYQNHVGFVKIKENYLFENIETETND